MSLQLTHTALCGFVDLRGLSPLNLTETLSRYSHSIARACLISAAALLGCSESPEAAIGRGVATQLDTINGHPIVVVNAFWCDRRIEDCMPGSIMPAASPRDASSIAGGFAEALGLPLVDHGGFQSPPCPWREGTNSEAGLYAQFVGPPVVDSDSAVVELSTGCADGRAAFEQIHRFVLRRHNGEWLVEHREMMSIT